MYRFLCNLFFTGCRIFFLPFYGLEILIPRKKNIWIFGDRNGKKYSDNSKAFFEYVNKNSDIKAVWLTRNFVVYRELKKKGYRVEYCNSFRGILYSLIAGRVFVSLSTHDVNSYCLCGAIIINLTHGAPLKKSYYSDISFPNNWVTSLKRVLFQYLDWLKVDLIVSPSPFFEAMFKEEFDKQCRICSTGYPRNDVILSNYIHPLIIELRNKYPGVRIVMYLPTFRGDGSFFYPFEDYGFDIEECKKCLENNNIVLLIKAHPGQKSNLVSYSIDRIVEISETPLVNVNEFYSGVDVLITDYSGAYYDFILSRKPIILAPFDYADYIKNSRSLHFDYDGYIEGVKVYTWSDLFRVLSAADYYAVSEATILKFNYAIDCNNCKRLFDFIMNGNK